MAESTAVYRIGEGLGHMVLSDHLSKQLRAGSSGQNLVGLTRGDLTGPGFTRTSLGTSSGSFENVSDS